MNDFKEAVNDYLGLRRGLGFKLKKHTRFLEEFASFLQRTDESMITSRLALQGLRNRSTLSLVNGPRG